MSTTMSPTVTQQRVAVATYDSYAQAQQAIDHLADQHFPVQHAAIQGVGLRMVEEVLARLTYLRSAAFGAANGAWIGALLGLFLALFTVNPVSFLAVVLWALVWGAVAGAIFGVLAHAFAGGSMDFITASQLVADRYEVLVDQAYADQARQLLASRSG